MTDRAKIAEFLQAELASGAVAVRDLEAKARAAGLLSPDLPISQCMPFRTVANKLHVLRYRENDKWWWRLPNTKTQGDAKVIETVPETEQPAPEVSQDDIAAARRLFMEKTLRWHDSAEAQAAMKAGLESAERYLKTGDLKDLHTLED
jgi:hypothetical protein